MTDIKILAKPRYGINPRNSQLYNYLEESFLVDELSVVSLFKSYDILHIHWPDRVFKWRMPIWLALLVLFNFLGFFKSKGVKIVYTLHNPVPRLVSPVQQVFISVYYKILNYFVDGLVVLSEDQGEIAKKLFPKVKLKKIIPLGIQDVEVSADAPQTHSIDIEAPFVFVAGMQERTKRTEEVLVELERFLPLEYNILICGVFPDPEYYNELRGEFDDPKFHFVNTRLTDDEYYSVIRSSSAVVISQSNPTNSGVATLAVALGTACYTNSSKFVADFCRQYGDGYVGLISSITSATIETAGEGEMVRFRMKDVAAETAVFYKEICGS